MIKELKISELANLWCVSVPSTWNRVRKEGLQTVKKLDENKKEITYVVISDDLLNKYINNVYNDVNNGVNNRHYEDILSINNIADTAQTLNNTDNTTLSQVELFEKLTALNKDYNDRLQQINNDLIDSKSKLLLLEDKAGREGFYINEINELKNDNNRLKQCLYWLITLIIILLIGLTWFITYNYKANIQPEANSTLIENLR